MRHRLAILLGISVCYFAAATISAKAQDYSSDGYGYWYGLPYRYYQQDRIPYFSLYPPVYYSRPVPRSYGYSPFAYPPGTLTPEPEEKSQPLTIYNPYVPKFTELEPMSEKSSNASAVIVNPYYRPKAELAAQPVAERQRGEDRQGDKPRRQRGRHRNRPLHHAENR